MIPSAKNTEIDNTPALMDVNDKTLSIMNHVSETLYDDDNACSNNQNYHLNECFETEYIDYFNETVSGIPFFLFNIVTDICFM